MSFSFRNWDTNQDETRTPQRRDRGGGLRGQNRRGNSAMQDRLNGRTDSQGTDSQSTDSQGLNEFPGYDKDWHAVNDTMIAKVTAEFNKKKGWKPGDSDYLDPNLVKAWALQESGSHKRVFSSGDMMQVNNTGDWVNEKKNFGMKKREKLDPEKSLRTALEWAYYKGEITQKKYGKSVTDGWHDTQRGSKSVKGYESKFTDWDTAMDNYNGGGVSDYSGDIRKRQGQGTQPK